MEKTIIAANWKSHKTKIEAQKWLSEIALKDFPDNLEVVIFPPFTLLDYVCSFIKVNDLPMKVGAQDISPFNNGAFTGEVSADQVSEFATYVLIGHSERRLNFSESNSTVEEKIKKAKEAKLTPIVCISDLGQLQDFTKDCVIAYEPVEAIGTDKPEDPKIVGEFAEKIRSKTDAPIIYGGSLNPDNIKSYLSLKNVSGLLIGGQSLNEISFMKIIQNAS